MPLTAGAGGSNANAEKGARYVSPGLLDKAKSNPGQKIRIIVQSDAGTDAADNSLKGAGSLKKRLSLIGAVSIQVPAAKVAELAKVPGLTITPDAPVKISAYKSTQLWPYVTSNSALWPDDQMRYSASTPTIAVVDSGIQPGRADFGNRLVGSVNLSTLPNNSPGDGRGHGTFVAGIAADSISGLAGAAPAAKLLSIDVMDDNGMGLTSDIVNSCQWILDHKAQYNIRVANFSLHSSMPSHFTNDPLDKAVEKLWFGGVTVVAAAGNYAVNGQESGVRYAPANDPFVITVGALDLMGTAIAADDTVAPWSAYGYTYDGFRKPEISAAGRYMVGPVPTTSTLPAQRPDHVVFPGYMQLSGTSFSAPVVSGTVAEMLARSPGLTPDQVKGALMVTARSLKAANYAGGVGEITPAKAAKYASPPNPNLALEAYVTTDPVSGGQVFDSASWSSAVQSNASWSSASWASASWSDAAWSSASWSDASWASASWSDASWSDASWSDASWSDASWSDASYEDAAEGDANQEGGYPLDPADVVALAADPELAPGADTLPDGSSVFAPTLLP